MIVWLASYPRSGNTFARVVLQRMYGISSPTIYQATTRPAMFPEINRQILPEEARTKAELVVFKTHELPSDDAPAIYLVRDGRDALVSHAHYVLNFDLNIELPDRRQFHELLRKLIQSDDWFGGWGSNVLAWTSRRAPTAVLRFEDLISAPVDCIRTAIAQLALPLAERRHYQVPPFSELHARIPNFFRRGGVDNWRDEMPDDLHELFWQRHGAAMDALGYQRGGLPAAARSSTSAA